MAGQQPNWVVRKDTELYLLLSLQLVYKINKGILDKSADVLGGYTALIKKILLIIHHLDDNKLEFANIQTILTWWTWKVVQEKHRRIINSCTIALHLNLVVSSWNIWLGSCLQIWREIFVTRELLHLRWIKCRFALSSPPGFFVDLVERKLEWKDNRRDQLEETSVSRRRLRFHSGIVIGVC